MPLLTRTVTTPLTVEIRRGAVAGLRTILADRRISAGGDVAVVVGPGQGARITELIRPQLGAADLFPVPGGTLDVAQDLGAKLRSRRYDAVVGIGGGKTIDVAKWAASQYGLPMVSVATSLGHDGLASPVAVLDHDGERGSHGVQIPIAVVVDLDFVADASPSQSTAGVGEIVSNLSAVSDWRLAQLHSGENVDGLAAMLAQSCGEAVLNHPGSVADDDFLLLLADSLVASGIAMAVAGSSRPCSGGCHEISHALDLLHPGLAAHGEQVGLGALFCSFLRGEIAQFHRMLACLRRHNLPTSPSDLGLTRGQFVEALVRAPATRPERYTILEHCGHGPAEWDRQVAIFEEAAGA